MDTERSGPVREFQMPINFEDLNLSEIPLKELPEYVIIPVIIDGQVFNLKFTLLLDKDTDGKEESREIKIYLVGKDENPDDIGSTAQALMWGGLSFHTKFFKDGSIMAKTGIQKNKQGQTLPRGLGKMLYTKMIDYIENQINFFHKNITHYVNHLPSYGLSKEKWLKNFEPLLHERGYERVSKGKENEQWEKTYYFNKQ